MVSYRPAYSAAFHHSRLVNVPALNRIEGITPDWAWGDSTGAGVRVAVVDSGIDETHPDIGAVQGYATFSHADDGGVRCDRSPHTDAHGHGTACAGIIRSLARECELYSVKVLGNGLAGLGEDFEAALRWVLDNDIQVCNLSLGTRKREFVRVLYELADRAYFRNVALVTAASNHRFPSFPSLYSSVFSVASHSVPEPYTFYYNPEPPVEFGAPGIDVRVAWQGHKHRVCTGNSYASPHITGLLAKILGKNPTLTVFQLKTVLRELAANVDRGETVSDEPPHR